MRETELRPDKDGYFRRNIGYKNSLKGRQQPKLNLGRNKRLAQERLDRIKAIWRRQELNAIEEQEKPVWDQLSLSIAIAVGNGKKEYLLDKLHPGLEPIMYVKYVEGVARLYPEITVMPADEAAYRAGKKDEQALLGRIEDEEKEILAIASEMKAGVLETVGNARKYQHLLDDRTLYEALDAYCKYIETSKFDKTENAVNDTGNTKLSMVKQIKTYLKNKPLSSLGSFEELDAEYEIFRNRPITHRYRKPMAKKTATNLMGEMRQFFRWLDRSKKWDWKLPGDHQSISHTPIELEIDDEHQGEEIPVYKLSELRILFEYATPLERLLLLLAINCSFGADQIGRLKIREVMEDNGVNYIQRIRKKKKVRGKHRLFKLTMDGIRWSIKGRESHGLGHVLLNGNGNSFWRKTKGGNRCHDIPNAWYRLVDRVRLDHPDFPRHGFNTLRDTSANLIRKISGGEAASIHLTHRHNSSDRNLWRYTNIPWRIVFKAQKKLEKRLAKVFAGVENPWTNREHQYVSNNQIKKMRQFIGEGNSAKMVAEKLKVAISTVYRWAHPKKYSQQKSEIGSLSNNQSEEIAAKASKSAPEHKAATASDGLLEAGTINVVIGSHDLNVDVVGYTVHEAHEAFEDLLSLPKNLQAFVNGRQIDDPTTYKLQNGDRLEFMLPR